jgi:hypothetical protein
MYIHFKTDNRKKKISTIPRAVARILVMGGAKGCLGVQNIKTRFSAMPGGISPAPPPSYGPDTYKSDKLGNSPSILLLKGFMEIHCSVLYTVTIVTYPQAPIILFYTLITQFPRLHGASGKYRLARYY